MATYAGNIEKSRPLHQISNQLGFKPFIVLCLGMLLMACAGVPATYQGVPLPTPVVSPPFRLPSAWMISGQEAIPGTIAAGGTNEGHFEPSYALPDLVTVQLSPDETITIYLGWRGFTDLQVTVRPWNSDGSIVPLIDETARIIAYTARKAGRYNVIELEPIDDSGDLLMILRIAMEETNAFYLWRLKPSS